MRLSAEDMDDLVEERNTPPPFIEIRDAHQEALIIDHRRIISVRAPYHPEEKRHEAVIRIAGRATPLNVNDGPEVVIALMHAAAEGDLKFITLRADGIPLYVVRSRIIAFKAWWGKDGTSGSLVYIEGTGNSALTFDNDWAELLAELAE